MPFFQNATGTTANNSNFSDINGTGHVITINNDNSQRSNYGNTTSTHNTDSYNDSSTKQTMTGGGQQTVNRP
ncbi:hypothetical protein SERLA73DRAFT_178900 [Serpula lacrymans var. lacrymans S7.3]|uniref:Uncharacterized protein n=2 Tax=Serpula lacrymans var. lacrymans TaxID=341189 RepID=F8PT76_SERL3|nr:uncharacterized protein SERLADRAFT_463687 [Serpula lacrymans var. lacrymans S7.9]EGO00906.1 hypothetical protein SERLA73DRAFT_178900 [Serpula lacrymans var. lacrymans S7.3]EGO26522.1 hypothetical protein SERLADRAFT_463687 [Serpula lacrymans var. lacrymans S7.9]